MKACLHCGSEFQSNNARQVFCSKKCQLEKRQKNYYEINGKPPDLSSAAVGAIHELWVSIDLLRRGYEVYRALSAGSAVDLAVIKNKKIVMIEVTTGIRGTNGKLRYPLHEKNHEHFDIIAVVERNQVISYFPPLESISWLVAPSAS